MVIITTVNLSATAERVKPTLRHRRRGRHLIPIALLASAVAVSGLVAVGLGASSLPASTVVRIVAAHLGLAPIDPEISARQDAIVWELRAPRAIGAMLVGATLAAAGAALQAIVRNTLADPFLLGVSSGASLGAASVITLGVGSAIGGLTLMGGAFVGALAAIALVLALVRTGGPAASNRLVLAGITVSFFLAALTNLVVVASGDRDAIRAVMFWMLGSLGATRWEILPWLAILAALMVACAPGGSTRSRSAMTSPAASGPTPTASVRRSRRSPRSVWPPRSPSPDRSVLSVWWSRTSRAVWSALRTVS